MQIEIDRPTIPSTFTDPEKHAAAISAPRTVVVFGMPRGGTTMVAGICQRCGIHMGSDLPRNLEDQDFVGKSHDHMINAIKQRDQQFNVWGWKFPRAAAYLSDLQNALRNPMFILVWRDALSVATRGAKNTGDLNKSLSVAHSIQTQNLKFVSQTSAPILHVSYEKAVRHPVKLAEDVQAFTGVTDELDHDDITAFATPGTYK
ncbi:hypothetical protein WNY37_00025 [Henriciella sp. AS95]|uniref:hypothetical protein n=1 Tax=Henriciella sp. AS95 TaxID=3135782 RepID=UPI00317F91CB